MTRRRRNRHARSGKRRRGKSRSRKRSEEAVQRRAARRRATLREKLGGLVGRRACHWVLLRNGVRLYVEYGVPDDPGEREDFLGGRGHGSRQEGSGAGEKTHHHGRGPQGEARGQTHLRGDVGRSGSERGGAEGGCASDGLERGSSHPRAVSVGAGVLPLGGENSRPLQTVGVVFFGDKPNFGSWCGGERWPIDFGSVAGLWVLPWGGRAALRPGGAYAFAGGFGSMAVPVL